MRAVHLLALLPSFAIMGAGWLGCLGGVYWIFSRSIFAGALAVAVASQAGRGAILVCAVIGACVGVPVWYWLLCWAVTIVGLIFLLGTAELVAVYRRGWHICTCEPKSL